MTAVELHALNSEPAESSHVTTCFCRAVLCVPLPGDVTVSGAIHFKDDTNLWGAVSSLSDARRPSACTLLIRPTLKWVTIRDVITWLLLVWRHGVNE
jgi:hypothetical protein